MPNHLYHDFITRVIVLLEVATRPDKVHCYGTYNSSRCRAESTSFPLDSYKDIKRVESLGNKLGNFEAQRSPHIELQA